MTNPSAKKLPLQGVQHEFVTDARRGYAHAAAEDALGQAAYVFARAGFPDPTLVLRWPDIAGPRIAHIAQPVKWQEEAKGGAVLTLKCEPGAIVFLQHQTRSILEKLNAYLGQNRVIRIKLIGAHFDPPEEPAIAAETPSLPLPNSTQDPLASALERLAARRRAKPPMPLGPSPD